MIDEKSDEVILIKRYLDENWEYFADFCIDRGCTAEEAEDVYRILDGTD